MSGGEGWVAVVWLGVVGGFLEEKEEEGEREGEGQREREGDGHSALQSLLYGTRVYVHNI